MNTNDGQTEFTVVFDNVSYQQQLKTEWGYSCVIKSGEDTILFDTGSNGEILLHNLSKLNIDPNSIKIIIISHIHWDHIGGLMEVLKQNSNVSVYLPLISRSKIEDHIIKMGAKLKRVNSYTQITDKIFTAGELDSKIPEQSIFVRTNKGIVLLTGCAHPGIVKIIKYTLSVFMENRIYLALGGFHLKDDNSEIISKTVKTIFDLNVERVAPSHCTGDAAIAEFKKIYKDHFIQSGVGKKIVIQ